MSDVVSVNTEVEESGPWKVFAIIGFVVGIVSLVFFWCPFECFYIAPFGIVFSALGKKSPSRLGKAKTGLILSIIAAIVNFIFTIVLLALAVAGAVMS